MTKQKVEKNKCENGDGCCDCGNPCDINDSNAHCHDGDRCDDHICQACQERKMEEAELAYECDRALGRVGGFRIGEGR